MEFRISDKRKKEVFISIFSILKHSSQNTNLIVNKTAIHIQGMDKSHVCLFDLNLSSEWFDFYQIEKEEDIELCFNTIVFHSMISTKSDDQILVLKLDTDNSETLVIELKNQYDNTSAKKQDYNKYFTLPLNEYDYDEMNIPQTDYDAEFSIPSKKVSDMLSQLSNFGDNINIKCASECVDFKSAVDSAEMRVNLTIDDMESYAVIEDGEVNLTYSLVYISKMCITNKLSNNIEFSLSNECPMKIRYDLGDNSSLVFYIAPQMTED